ncbi:MAG: RNA polymerase subunit sigma-70 [Hyphomicrobiales bacterium]|nr:MAG: RNA polymerase subunit sigma-70 [Hyphomicrobiales bacterium]
MRRNVARKFDEYLAASARTGDSAAFERLVKHWQPRLIAHAYRLSGEMELARDIVQDSWIDIYKGLPGLKNIVVFPAWAYRIVTRRTADAIRKITRKRRDGDALAAEPEEKDHSQADIEAQADRTPLNRAMAELSKEQHAAIGLHYIEGFSITEISIALKVPAGTVKTRLMHARHNLRAALEGENKNDQT